MFLKPFIKLSSFLLAATLLSSCGDSSKDKTTTESAEPVILTTFYPTHYFTEKITMGKVKVECPCPEDEDPIFWQPKRAVVSKYQQADMIVINGAEFEKWVAKVSLPQTKLVDSAKGIELLNYETATTHSHGPAGEHSHTGVDGHTWVDPLNALYQATAIYNAVAEQFPEHKDAFAAGFAELTKELKQLDSELKAVSKKMADTPILCSHPAYNYVGRRYGWNLKNLDLDPEAKLTEKQISDIRESLKTHPAKILVWEGEPTDEVANQVTEKLGLTSIVFSPCEGAPSDSSSSDYFSIMTNNVKVLKDAISKGE